MTRAFTVLLRRHPILVVGLLSLVVLIAILAIALLLVNPSPTDDGEASRVELTLARQAALLRLSGDMYFTEFEGADIVSAQPYYDLEGDLICHMFGVAKEDEVLGTIIVGSSAYDNIILGVNNAPPPSVPSATEIRASLENDLGLAVSEKGVAKPERLLHLGPASDWVLYEVRGQSVAVHLWTMQAAYASDLKFSMSTPEQMRQYNEMREIQLPENGPGTE